MQSMRRLQIEKRTGFLLMDLFVHFTCFGYFLLFTDHFTKILKFRQEILDNIVNLDLMMSQQLLICGIFLVFNLQTRTFDFKQDFSQN